MLDNLRKVCIGSDNGKLFLININYISFFLAAVTAIFQATAIYWIYEPYGWILAGYTGLTFLIGFTAIVAGIRLFTVLYLLAFTPILVPTIYIIAVLGIVISQYDCCNYNVNCNYGCDGWGSFRRDLVMKHEGYLILGLGAGCLSIPLYVLTIVAFGRLGRVPPVPVFTATSLPQTVQAETSFQPIQPNATPQTAFIPSSSLLQHQTMPPIRPPPPVVRPAAAVFAVPGECEAPPAYPADEISYGAAPALFQPTPSTQPAQQFTFEKKNPYKEVGERRSSF